MPHVRLIHSVASESALRELDRHRALARPGMRILIEVNVAREPGKSGIAPEELDSYLERSPVPVAGLMCMPPLATDPEDSRRWFAALRELAAARGLTRLSMGTSQDFAVAVEEGATIVRIGTRLYSLAFAAPGRRSARWSSISRETRPPGETAPVPMAFRDSWHRALVYFGLAEEYHDDYDDDVQPEPEVEDRYRERPNVRRLRRRRDEFDDIFADDEPRARSATALRSVGSRGNGNGDVRVHLVVPKSFNDAQQIADKFKDSIPVILNLQCSETDLSKRLIDFASGLTYALDGGMQRIADKVFMLTPRNVEISAEERARLIEKGFFNQS